MNELMIIVPGILNFLCWFVHLNATHRMSIFKFLMLTVGCSLVPVLNILTLFMFVLLAIMKSVDSELLDVSDTSKHSLGFLEDYDESTFCGKVVTFFTKNR